MHELSIALAILRAARSELAAHGGGKLDTVIVAVGELSAVEPELLSYAWQGAIAGGEHEGARLVIEWMPAEQTCMSCGVVDDRQPGTWLRLCPVCDLPLHVRGGSELELVELTYERESVSQPVEVHS